LEKGAAAEAAANAASFSSSSSMHAAHKKMREVLPNMFQNNWERPAAVPDLFYCFFSNKSAQL
jgi:hypothetical protein